MHFFDVHRKTDVTVYTDIDAIGTDQLLTFPSEVELHTHGGIDPVTTLGVRIPWAYMLYVQLCFGTIHGSTFWASILFLSLWISSHRWVHIHICCCCSCEDDEASEVCSSSIASALENRCLSTTTYIWSSPCSFPPHHHFLLHNLYHLCPDGVWSPWEISNRCLLCRKLPPNTLIPCHRHIPFPYEHFLYPVFRYELHLQEHLMPPKVLPPRQLFFSLLPLCYLLRQSPLTHPLNLFTLKPLTFFTLKPHSFFKLKPSTFSKLNPPTFLKLKALTLFTFKPLTIKPLTLFTLEPLKFFMHPLSTHRLFSRTLRRLTVIIKFQ